ncbi:glutathione synthetase [Rhizobium sp. Root1220]|uniref:glutathione synthetase n=1 Tax=Rhizobium sp. Root1220 TaxID=1736432 RepID=UPI0006FAE740|nr:glutathione synthetase [Rhizobium sp. Root1220]KQV81864.1 glutathione synthetase [Rhizobium sp. Root1220]
MRIAFLVNSIAGEASYYTTTSLALAAIARGHDIFYVTPGDFVLRPDDSLHVRAVMPPIAKQKKADAFIAGLNDAGLPIETINVGELDVLFLRNDPSEDADDRPWAAHVGAMFGRLAVERGVITVNDPHGLARAQNKLYFQDFPEAIRPATLISRSIDEIRAFVADHKRGVILKPLQGSGGRHVFKVASNKESNLNQIFEAVSGEGYLIAQGYLPEAVEGDIRLFLMNGHPLERDGAYAAFRRVPAKGELRSNMNAAGTAAAVKITPEILRVADMVRPKLIADGMFLVGLDIVGDKILEINVFTPGGLPNMLELYGVDFSADVIGDLERKVAIRKNYGNRMANNVLATL